MIVHKIQETGTVEEKKNIYIRSYAGVDTDQSSFLHYALLVKR